MSGFDISVLGALKPLVFDPRLAMLTMLLVLAASVDVRQHRIPNLLVLVGLCVAVMYNGLYAPSVQENGWLLAIKGALVGFFMLLPLYLVRAMGAGDVKLMAMVGAFLGPLGAFCAVLGTFVAGGILAITMLVWKRRLRRALGNVYHLVSTNLLAAPAGSFDFTMSGTDSVGKLPYAVAIAAGTVGYLILHSSGHLG
jgi:prepilin peptidase CpaA